MRPSGLDPLVLQSDVNWIISFLHNVEFRFRNNRETMGVFRVGVLYCCFMRLYHTCCIDK